MWQCSAPGSVMLTGEHAILNGEAALVAAVDKRITVQLTPRTDDKIIIHSERLGEYTTSLSTLKSTPPFEFVLNSLILLKDKINTGLELNILSDFSHQVGLGSSAACTVATLAVISHWQGMTVDLNTLFL